MPSQFQKFAAAVHADMADPSVHLLVGRKHLAAHGEPRRIVWTHAPSTVDLPQQAGGALVGSNATGQRHQVVWTRLEVAEIWIFAESPDADPEGPIDQLFNNLLASIAIVIPRVRMDGYRWFTEEEAQAGHMNWQPAMILRCAFRIQVSDEKKPLAEVTGLLHNCQLITEETPFDPEAGAVP